MEEKKQPLNFAAILGRVLTVFITLLLVVYFISVLMDSSAFFSESAEKNAIISFEEDVVRAEALAEAHYNNLYGIAERLKYTATAEEVQTVVSSYIGSDLFGDLRYYAQGVSYSANGAVVEYEISGREYIESLVASNAEGCTPVYFDSYPQADCIAFFVPIRGSLYADGILSIVPARNIINVGTVINEKASVVAIVDESGKVLSDTRAASFEATVGNNFYEFITALTHDKSHADRVGEAVALGKKTAVTLDSNSERYTLAVAPLSNFDGHLSLVSMSVSEGLIAPEMTYVRHIVNFLVIAVLALAVGFVYALLYHKKSKQALSAATLLDAKLECPNAAQFKITAKELMAIYKHKYAITVISIRNFFFLREQLGEENCTKVLKAMVKVIQSLSNKEECFGYAGDGKFLLLMINANSHSIHDKIKLIETISNREEMLADTKIRFAAGVYNAAAAHGRTVQEMIDCANTACGFCEDNISTTYTLFTEEVKKEIEQNEKIEAIMESALQNGEFRVFFQPKYGVQTDSIHSAEALVRWFDPVKGDYRFPGAFIPLFETNGFIVKLDHFVYIEVLKYLSSAVERGEKVVPIAVNVSRVTATSPDFINFYVGNKKNYRIPDGFITLELTESFAMENYDKISGISSALHNGGLCCSIDDFGSGYSSFSILKQINVDELKLDRVFVTRGVDIQRDDTLLSMIIELGKSMGMRIVQEGVETKEIFDKVVAMGCDVVQGYYYAKAISMEEFKIFINTNTSIKYKSLVK